MTARGKRVVIKTEANISIYRVFLSYSNKEFALIFCEFVCVENEKKIPDSLRKALSHGTLESQPQRNIFIHLKPFWLTNMFKFLPCILVVLLQNRYYGWCLSRHCQGLLSLRCHLSFHTLKNQDRYIKTLIVSWDQNPMHWPSKNKMVKLCCKFS